MTDYRFSLQRKTQRFSSLGVMTPLVMSPLVIPPITTLLPSALQPSFSQILATVGERTDALQAEYEARNSRGTLNTALGSPFLVMPDCPPDGPWGYVYKDIFDGAKENLRKLNETGAKGTPEQNFDWASLVLANAELVRGATNISDMFLFPKDALLGAPTTEMTPDEAARSTVEAVPWRTPSGAVYSGARATVKGYRTDSGGNDPAEVRFSAKQLGVQTLSRLRVVRPDIYASELRRALSDTGNRTKPVRDAGADPTAQMRALAPLIVWDPTSSACDGRCLDMDASRNTVGVAPASDWGIDGDFRAVATEGGGRGLRFWFPYLHLSHLRTVARVYSALDLNTVITDAFAFYAFNHNVHYAGKLGLTNEQVRAMQTAAMAATAGTGGGLVSGVAAAINPIAGVVAAALSALLVLLIQAVGAATGDVYESPFSLNRRVPRVGCETVGSGGGTPGGGTPVPYDPTFSTEPPAADEPIDDGRRVSVESGVSPLAVAAALAAGLLLLSAAKKSKKERTL